jgi:hypothetical protein
MNKTTAATWTTTHGCDTTTIDRYTVIVWTGSPAADLDDGYQVCSAYIPTTDRQFPDGVMLVGRRRLETRDRQEARDLAIQLALDAIADFEADLRRVA